MYENAGTHDLLAMAFSMITGCNRQVDVKLGYVGPLSGPLQDLGKDLLQGAQVAVDELNRDEFLINGKRAHFKLLVEDDKKDAETGRQRYRGCWMPGLSGR
jgi:branched-chain amino acid transport system substrate-binding protein